MRPSAPGSWRPGRVLCCMTAAACLRLDPASPNALAGRKRPLHTIIPAFAQKGDTRVAFGIMGGWNQSQAHAQFVANISDFKMNIQAALEAPRFSKHTFDGCDVAMENRFSGNVRNELDRQGPQDRFAGIIFELYGRRTGGAERFRHGRELWRIGPAKRWASGGGTGPQLTRIRRSQYCHDQRFSTAKFCSNRIVSRTRMSLLGDSSNSDLWLSGVP